MIMSERVEDVRESAFDAPATGLAAQVAELEATVQTLNELLAKVSARMLRGIDDVRDETRNKVGYGDLAGIRKDLERIGSRIDDIVSEVGYGEALDLAKVPPAILEHAYQAILDDLVAALRKALGEHDSDMHIVRSLEQLRLKTSGSELFHYRAQDHRIEVGLRKPLEKGLVSARQVQMTYEELQRHLREPIHTHTPKNFRALVKIKSGEFAVDRALHLGREVDQAIAQTSTLRDRLDRLETQVAGALKDVQEFAAGLRDTLANVATGESVEALQMRVAAIEGRLQAQESKSATPEEPPIADRVLTALAGRARSLAELRRDLGVSDSDLHEVLVDLESRHLITSSMRGRTAEYRLREESDNA